MEKGDVYGLIGMILGAQAIMDVVLYFIYGAIPIFEMMMPIMIPLFYAMCFGGGGVGVILSIIGISKNRSKFGYIGLLTSLGAVVIFGIVIFVLPVI